MIGAIIYDNCVWDFCFYTPENKSYLEKIKNCKILDASAFGLVKGDCYHKNDGWYRNCGGEEKKLSLVSQEEYDKYVEIMTSVINIQNALATTAKDTGDEIITILQGE